MLPIFGDERRRNINLGGASSASTQATILDQAKQRRILRDEQKRQHENAVILQAWWRGVREARLVRRQMRMTFESDVMGITGLRCLVLIGQDEEAMGVWSNAMLAQNPDSFTTLCSDKSWVVLVRQLSLRLLRSVATAPQSSNAASHLKVLTMLTQSSISADVMRYLLSHGGYGLFSRSILGMQWKNSLQLPLLVPLLTASFTIFPPPSPEYLQAIIGLFSDILTIALLPNRMPIPSLMHFSSALPFSQLPLLEPHFSVICTKDIESKVNLIANLLAFTPPARYSVLTAVLPSYLSLLTAVFNSLPVNALDPPAANTSSWSLEDSDDEDNHPLVSVVTDFNAAPLPTLDPRTIKRLQTLHSPAHLSSIIANCRSSIIPFILSLTSVWPAKRDGVLTAVLMSTGSGFLRELYRNRVRSLPIGKDENPGAVMDPAYADAWPSLLLLVDLYTQSLLTMGDDEFFGSSGTRNPLTLDDLTSFSRQLLNIAFILYWRDDQTGLQKEMVCPDVRCTWEGAREKVTKCLLAIHSRDSRKPFVPPEHWLVSSQIDMNGFIEAAVYEDQILSDDTSTKAPTKRQMALLSPRLGVLNNIPFAIPFDVRVSIFRNFVLNDSRKHSDDLLSLRYNRTAVKIRRDHIAEDGFDKLGDANLKDHVQITFIDKFGEPEAGIDGGGVFKEFFTSLCKEVFDTDRGLWLANNNNELYPNPHGYAREVHSLSWYRFIGRILGKAIYEGILVDVAFAGFFLAKWLGRQNLLDDLASLDPELYNGLMFLKHYTGNPEDLSLNFTVAIEEFGVTKSIDLIPEGSTTAVTRENRLRYIYFVSHYRLSKQIKLQSEAFFEGLSETIDPKWLRMFNQQEVQILIGGVNSPIDLEDLRENTNYGGLYDNNEPTIVAFWKVVETFDQDQRRALLRFVTSCSRPPLLGFKELVPKFGIRDSGSDEHRLPTASTCFNLLKLPRYQSEKVLKDKLLRAITSGAGFDLS
ncbi:HECT-domain-containing protein [Armillaria luteobubalina]|uniref:HECT-type E3 ubiquitin transferase n=1 Tax=Armillaria luteobubalina TaxID=153913 RepID=A0AA39QPB4_9AGAR|nr:HECT-domain-containing protein [Armillaria luteobubalina]